MVKCLICHSDFRTYPSRLKKGEGKYCSRKCQFESQKGIAPKVIFIGIGRDNPFYGKHHSEEAKEKNRLAHIGKSNIRFSFYNNCKICDKEFRVAQWNRSRKFCSKRCSDKSNIGRMKGSLNPSWRGGVSNPNRYIRTTTEYYQWRANVFKRDNYTCQICLERGGELQADHIKPFAFFPELRFELSNGRTLCKPCHLKTDTWGRRAYA